MGSPSSSAFVASIPLGDFGHGNSNEESISELVLDDPTVPSAASDTSNSLDFFTNNNPDGNDTLAPDEVDVAPVPLPAGMALILTAIAGLALIGRSRKSESA